MPIIKDLVRVIRSVGELLVLLAIVIAAAWAFGAVWFDAPFGNANKIVGGLLAIASAAALVFVRHFWRKVGATALLFGGVLAWWLTLSPTNDSDWQPDVAQTAWADIQGDKVTLHNVRNCDYRTQTDYTPHWETRTVRILQITGIDLAVDYWGSPWIAHPIASFQFADAPPLCFSIETRKKLGQTYSTIGGLYRQFELIYIVADERDVIRLRTNYRNEDIYLYRTTISPARARERFLEYIHSLNALRNKPRWYNAITTNCTTSIRTQHPPKERVPWDWRILVNGKGDELLYERHAIVTGGLPFAELKTRSLIDTRARAANDSPDFSKLIREGLPWGLRSDTNPSQPQPYHGYYFKVLKGQGPAAPLGQLDFVVKGAMIGGFALAAAPAQYRVTGVKTFIVSHDGVVYEKDLGPDTLKAFQSMDRFNPDKSWQPTNDEWPAEAVSQ